MPWTTRSNCFTAARERGEEAMSLGSKAKWVACRGMSRSSWGRSHTTQQRPKRASYVMATSGNVCPQRGCRGSRTVMVCSGDTLCPKGVVPWLRFSNARGAGDEHIVPLVDPLARGQAEHEGFIKPTRVTIVKVLQAGTQPQLGLPQAGGEPAVTSDRHLAIDQQAQAFFETERLALRQVHLLAERFGPARASKGQQLVAGGVVQHMGSPVL